MATTTIRLTDADLENYPLKREGDRHELIDGELYVTPSPIPLHETVTVNFVTAVGPVVHGRRLGRLFTAPVDVWLSPNDLVVPDICFVARDRLGIVGPKRIDGAPDLVVEILSPSTRTIDLTKKKALYRRFGVPEYWVIDPVARSVTIFALENDRYVDLPAGGGIARSRAISGLGLIVADLFEV
jgi:Uma2 family endonuclease